MGKRRVGALEKVDADLPNLQHKIRRDPLSYKAEFYTQYQQYESFRQLFLYSPQSAPDESVISLRDLIDFIAHVAQCYPDLTAKFPGDLIALLSQNHQDLEPDLRDKVVGSLVILRNKDIIDSSTLFNTFYPILLSTPSKSLRTLLYQKILLDIRSSNAKSINHKLNRTLQTTLHSLVTGDRTSPKGIWAVRIVRELWRRQVWTEAKAVEVMKEAALSEDTKVIIGGVRFFLGGDKEREEAADESSDDNEEIDMGQLRHQAGVTKKTKKKERALKNAAATVKKKERKKNKPSPLNFSALHLLHDPQSFAESLFYKHLQSNKSKLNLEQKFDVLQLVSRLVGLHKLIIVTLYSYYLKYLTPRQPSVTSFLASLAQSTHSLVPPDSLEPLIQKIANEFVSEASASQVAAVGLNSIREICVRQPLAMNETLLQDLIMYKKSKDKGVMMAAKGLLSLYRTIGPDKLKKRDRGKEAALSMRSSEFHTQRYGEESLGEIEGLHLLEKWKEEEKQKKRLEKGLSLEDADDVEEEEDDVDWKAWDVQEDESDDSGGWIDVQSDGEDIDVSDSDDDKPAMKKQKTENQDSTTSEPALENDAANAVQKELGNISNLATTKILTPADFAKLNELRMQASVNKLLPQNKRQRKLAAANDRHVDDPLTAAEIEAPSSLGKKITKEEKIAAAKKDREESHQSSTARRKEKIREAGKSSTNKEKARKKNFMMTLGKAKKKQKHSLVERSKVLKGHIERQKKGGRRGNR